MQGLWMIRCCGKCPTQNFGFCFVKQRILSSSVLSRDWKRERFKSTTDSDVALKFALSIQTFGKEE
ncbi:hypothetical protein ACRE_017120 [Hapsidospora chrysogenum ATCC 11550]|uniref:Uncharacterized protein n=1 Tax=Hapsidospora chrysogenum (strain ATCC 11550 / CBS 779.69 / DSM 880 / IAM 14645 / JCM 23072 / IMI 49137) TaxID=857340 RepID=A0A086TDT8_HAPC1|nr:hypothetical protein ACRE_017120 [Hapsidospora chrysogenum ATCC 11550]